MALIKDRKTNEAVVKGTKACFVKRMKRCEHEKVHLSKMKWQCEALNLFFKCIRFCLSLFILKHYCMLDNIF